MEVRIEQIGKEREELILICCHAVTDEVREIETFIKSRQGSLSGVAEEVLFIHIKYLISYSFNVNSVIIARYSPSV